MTWIYQHKDWPNFIWDAAALEMKLADIRNKQGRLLGRMSALGFDLKCEASLKTLTNDIVKSYAIEGEKLNSNAVRSSIARRLGVKVTGLIPVSRDIDNIVEMMLDVTQNYAKPLTAKRLFDWYATFFPKMMVAAFRTEEVGPMRVVSGPIGRETVHFEAPVAKNIPKEMKQFLKWFEQERDIDPVLKSGLAHFWFVTIHPFEDGNGRIARAIADMAMARADGTSDRFYSVTTQIEASRKVYYDKLETQQRGSVDVTLWLSWFLDCLQDAIFNAEQTLSSVLYKSQLWAQINQQSINERQRIIINRMLENFKGYMNTSKYAKLAKCSTDTALRDIQSLTARGILVKNPSGGRSTSYRLPDESEMANVS